MGKKSVKENKNMYYVYREKKGYTREQMLKVQKKQLNIV